jgi:hypothetical protein
MPVYPLVIGILLHALEHASSPTQVASDDDGEYYAMALAEVVTAAAVPNEAVIIIPLTPPQDGEVLDFTYLARSHDMFVQVHEKPLQRMTCGHVLGHSAGTVDPPTVFEEVFKFPTSTTFIVAKPRLVLAIRAATGPCIEVDKQLAAEVSKRQYGGCGRAGGGYR